MAESFDLDRVNKLCNRMVVDDPNEGGLVLALEDVPAVTDEYQFCLVGRFLIEKPINNHAMQNTFAAL